MNVLTWNLFHGRAQPAAGRDLFAAFADALAGWEWDVALLQECPPWWPRPLAERLRASMRMCLTSRNELLALRRAIAVRLPDLIKSGGGGCNAILVRGAGVADHRRVLLRRFPERRWMHAVRLSGGELDGAWVGNLHASQQRHARPVRDVAKAGAALERWAGPSTGRPVLLGGDFNLPDPSLPGFVRLASHSVDHILGRGVERRGDPRVLDPRPLSDHRPLLVDVVPLD